MKMWALVLMVGVCSTIHAGPVDQRSVDLRETQERNLQKLSVISAENDLYTLFSADQKGVPVNVVVEKKVVTLGDQLTISVNLEDSLQNTIDAAEEHSKVKLDIIHGNNVKNHEALMAENKKSRSKEEEEEDDDLRLLLAEEALAFMSWWDEQKALQAKGLEGYASL